MMYAYIGMHMYSRKVLSKRTMAVMFYYFYVTVGLMRTLQLLKQKAQHTQHNA